tara:strand:- start:246 stop:455 length:210 start_codon:yes stop_codon:yes gene_type:complete
MNDVNCISGLITKNSSFRESILAATDLKGFVSLDTRESSCQNTRTKLFKMSGKYKNVEKYQYVLLVLEI